MKVAFEAREKWSRRVGTSTLNRWFEKTIDKNPPPAPGGRRIKLRYITQAKTRPPTFIVFGNRLDELPQSYRRSLVNALRTGSAFAGVPIRLNPPRRTHPFDRCVSSPASTRGATGLKGPRPVRLRRFVTRRAAGSVC